METVSLDSILAQYYELKEQSQEDQAKLKNLSSHIKEYLKKNGLSEVAEDNYTAVVAEVNMDKLDEDKLICMLRDKYPEQAEKVIIKKEILDVDKLEDLVYNRIIDGNIIDSCLERREPSYRLYVRRNNNGTN